MRNIPGTTGSPSYSETSWESGDSTASIIRKDSENLILKANSVSLPIIMKHYGIRINDCNCKIVCPFKSHKGGRESTPSFNYYSDTNSFFCFGCKIGGKNSHGCEFVAAIESCNRLQAAYKIINLFSKDISDELNASINDHKDFSEKISIMMDFSDTVREFRLNNDDENSFIFIEKICAIYDRHLLKHHPNNEALSVLILELKKKIASYRPHNNKG